MNQDPYVVFTNAKGNAMNVVIAWLGAFLGPTYIHIGWGNYKDWPLFLGLVLLVLALKSMQKGYKALVRRAYSDFIVCTLVPVLILIFTITYGALVFYYGQQQ